VRLAHGRVTLFCQGWEAEDMLFVGYMQWEEYLGERKGGALSFDEEQVARCSKKS
jgi:hypothetical protein